MSYDTVCATWTEDVMHLVSRMHTTTTIWGMSNATEIRYTNLGGMGEFKV